MGNKFTSCGCQKNSFVYSDSPYSKQMSKNLIRFWAEVFLLAQEGSTNQTRWQKVVPKLVPVNVAKVQEAPAVVSHITAYNTKVDKVMDTLVFHPGNRAHVRQVSKLRDLQQIFSGVDLFRGSDCFVYWCDPQNGLTWGLNFITNEDAAFFVEILKGRAKFLTPRFSNSTQNLTLKVRISP
uniref:WH1 domain-containing protein n=1 Tax=Romanomermis culicivorax TaxID=13658 RepID=A0A915KN31_ROMCU